jgi:hypothetical protein
MNSSKAGVTCRVAQLAVRTLLAATLAIVSSCSSRDARPLPPLPPLPPLTAEDFRATDDMYKARPGKGENHCVIGVTGIKTMLSTKNGVVVEYTESGSPADGKLNKGDVIRGVNGVALEGLNYYVVLGTMLTRAEATDGRIVFDVQPAGGAKATTVEVTIPVLGRYSDTWPVDCAKSKKIIEQAAAYYHDHFMEVSGDGQTLQRAQGALFLLSTGDDAHLPRIKEFLKPFIEDPQSIGDSTWDNGYNGILCCEYYLRTGDASIMPVIQSYCDNARDRQYLSGWSHGGRSINPRYMDGALMNAAGANVLTSLLLAKECGADADEGTLLRSLKFYYRVVGHGSVPYGDHRPEGGLGSNGKNGMIAAAMLIASQSQGDVSNYKKAHDYLAMSTITSYPNLAKGHGDGGRGDVWWRGIAASYVRDTDPAAYQKAMNDLRWYYDLTRRASGGLGVSCLSGNWHDTGALLALTYTAPLKTLRITGAPRSRFSKDFELPARLWGNEADEAFLDDTNNPALASYGVEDPMHVTLARLGSAYGKQQPSPPLTKRELVRNMHHRRYMVRCQAAKALREMGALDELERFLTDADPRLRRAALDGLIDYSYHSAMGKNPIGPSQYTDGMIEAIAGMLKNPDEAWFVIDGALFAMSNMPAGVIHENMDLILPWTTHEEWWLRQSAFVALTGLEKDDALYRAVMPKLFDMLRAEGNEMSFIYTMKGHFNAVLKKRKQTSEMGRLIVAGLESCAKNKPIGEGWRGAIDGYNMAMLITDCLNRSPDTALPIARAVLKQVGKLKRQQLIRLLATPNSFHRWTGFYTVLDTLPAGEREALIEVLYAGFLPELHEHLADTSKGADVQLLNAAVDLRNLKSTCQWRPVGSPAPSERVWRYTTFGPLRTEDERDPYDWKTHFRRHKIQLPDGLDNWFMSDFDDSAWQRGRAPIGKGVFNIRGKPFKGKVYENASTWGDGEFILMRSGFDVDAEYDFYSINILDTQGYEIYLNGELLRKYIWYTKTPEYTRIVLDKEQIALLEKGRNVLAVYTNTEHLVGGGQFGQVDIAIEGLRKADLGMTP